VAVKDFADDMLGQVEQVPVFGRAFGGTAHDGIPHCENRGDQIMAIFSGLSSWYLLRLRKTAGLFLFRGYRSRNLQDQDHASASLQQAVRGWVSTAAWCGAATSTKPVFFTLGHDQLPPIP
jgi:hypothetical protein